MTWSGIRRTILFAGRAGCGGNDGGGCSTTGGDTVGVALTDAVRASPSCSCCSSCARADDAHAQPTVLSPGNVVAAQTKARGPCAPDAVSQGSCVAPLGVSVHLLHAVGEPSAGGCAKRSTSAEETHARTAVCSRVAVQHSSRMHASATEAWSSQPSHTAPVDRHTKNGGKAK